MPLSTEWWACLKEMEGASGHHLWVVSIILLYLGNFQHKHLASEFRPGPGLNLESIYCLLSSQGLKVLLLPRRRSAVSRRNSPVSGR